MVVRDPVAAEFGWQDGPPDDEAGELDAVLRAIRMESSANWEILRQQGLVIDRLRAEVSAMRTFLESRAAF